MIYYHDEDNMTRIASCLLLITVVDDKNVTKFATNKQ